jgi:predicted negative regulator of RcsB-dependent stress response
MDTLKDIKPLVVIADNSFIYLLVLLFVVLLIVLLAGYFGWKKFQLKRRNDQKRSALKILKNLDFNDSKATAYTFSQFSLYGK